MARRDEVSRVMADLARKQWKGVDSSERSMIMREKALSRWTMMTKEQRKAHGAMLAAARAAKRKARKKKTRQQVQAERKSRGSAAT